MGTGKSPVTKQFAAFLAYWARKLSWTDTANLFRTSWDIVADSVTWVVEWGLANRNIDDVTAIGVDQIQYHSGHNYLTLVYQIDKDCRRLLWIGKERKKKTLYAFCDFMGKKRCQSIEFVCSDMWKAYITVIADRFSNAVHVLGQFHIVAHLKEPDRNTLAWLSFNYQKSSRFCKLTPATQKKYYQLLELILSHPLKIRGVGGTLGDLRAEQLAKPQLR